MLRVARSHDLKVRDRAQFNVTPIERARGTSSAVVMPCRKTRAARCLVSPLKNEPMRSRTFRKTAALSSVRVSAAPIYLTHPSRVGRFHVMKNAHPAAPNNLLEVVRYFADPDVALQFMRDLRWPDGVTCPHCSADAPSFLKTRRIWKCRDCRKQFSVKVGTIFEDSALGLDKWLPALWLLANAKNGISSYELHRALKVTQKTAWFMLHRIRTAMLSKSFEKFSGDVEADETFVGGIAKNMHQEKRKRLTRNGVVSNKTVVVGLLQRGKKGESKSRVRVSLDQNLKRQRRSIGTPKRPNETHTQGCEGKGAKEKKTSASVIASRRACTNC